MYQTKLCTFVNKTKYIVYRKPCFVPIINRGSALYHFISTCRQLLGLSCDLTFTNVTINHKSNIIPHILTVLVRISRITIYVVSTATAIGGKPAICAWCNYYICQYNMKSKRKNLGKIDYFKGIASIHLNTMEVKTVLVYTL